MTITDTQLTGCPVDHGPGRCPASGVDLWDFDMFQRQEHHAVLERLRETDPGIHWVDESERGSGYWAITRRAHLKEVNRRADVFSSGHSGTQMRDPDQREGVSGIANDLTLIDMDPPRHTASQPEAACTSQSKTGSRSRESIISGCHCTPIHGR